MAVINGKTNHVEHSVLQTTWSGLTGATTDTGSPEELARYPVKAVQFSGTFGGTVVLEGSEDGVTYFTLTAENPAGGADVAISTAAAARFDVIGNPRFIRPRAAAGVTSVVCTLTSRQFGH